MKNRLKSGLKLKDVAYECKHRAKFYLDLENGLYNITKKNKIEIDFCNHEQGIVFLKDTKNDEIFMKITFEPII